MPEPRSPSPPPVSSTSSPRPTASLRLIASLGGALALTIASHAALPLYNIGSPSDEEQLNIELINRARAYPAAEGIRLAGTTDPDAVDAINFFMVDTMMMVTEFASIAPAPPVAPNRFLTNAARRHSADMLDQVFQSHTGSDGSTLASRASDAGYHYSSLAENVFSVSRGTFHGHAAFQIDWGSGPGGMQVGRGHRMNIHSATFREVGVGVVLGTNSLNGKNAGPQVVTQDFGTSPGGLPFVTGVAYLDLNNNETYDLGEGLGGVRVQVEGASHDAVTSRSGGYAVPVPINDANRAVTFTAPGINEACPAAISQGHNVKIDLALPYTPPVVTGPSSTTVGQASSFSIAAVPGATGYEWRSYLHKPATADSANSLKRVKTTVSPGYSVISTTVLHKSTGAYHLAHSHSSDQILLYSDSFYVGSSASLTFQSRLGLATPTQSAAVEISTDNGASWSSVYSQVGDGVGENTFSLRTAPLSAYSGHIVRLRFVYRASESYYPQTTDGIGWYIDTIDFKKLFTVTAVDAPEAAAGNRSFSFTPATLDSHLLQGRALLPGRKLPFGPIRSVKVVAAPVIKLPDALVGQFEGLFVPPSGTGFPLAKLELTVTQSGAFTGRLTHGGPGSVAVSGQLTPNAANTAASVTSVSAGNFTLRSVKISSKNAKLTATLRKAGSSKNIGVLTDGVKLKTFTKKKPAPWAAAYTAAFAFEENLDSATPSRIAPSGAGFGTGNVNPAGTLSLKGKLADGTAFTGSFASDASAAYRPFIQPHGTANNYLGGWLKLTRWSTKPSPRYRVAAADGQDFYWHKPAKKKDATYPKGFGPLALRVHLATYLPPTKKLPLASQLGLSSTNASKLKLNASGAGLSSSQRKALTAPAKLTAANALVVSKKAPAKLWPKLTLKPASGLLTGSIKVNDSPTSARTAPWSGVVLQLPPAERKKTLALGFLLLPPTSGASNKTLGGSVTLTGP